MSYQAPLLTVCTSWLALLPCGHSSRATRGSWILDFDFSSKPVPKAYPVMPNGTPCNSAWESYIKAAALTLVKNRAHWVLLGEKVHQPRVK